MKKLFFLSLIALSQITGCAPDNRPTPTDDLAALQQRFQGKYKVVASVSNEAVDVNLDGISSTNLMDEMSELTFAPEDLYYVVLRINGASKYSSEPSYLFTQFWPEQFIRIGVGKVWDGAELIDFNANYVVKYDNQGATRAFTFSPDKKQLNMLPNELEEKFKWARPESAVVQEDGGLTIVNKRRIYTRSGVKDIVVTTSYERFTMAN